MKPPVNIELLMEEWIKDVSFDETEPQKAMANISKLHAKYLRILQSAMPLFESTAIPVEVEYEDQVLSHYNVSSIECRDDQMEIHLASKHTGCLAPDRCGVPLVVLGGCSGPGCCE